MCVLLLQQLLLEYRAVVLIYTTLIHIILICTSDWTTVVGSEYTPDDGKQGLFSSQDFRRG